MKFRDMKPAIKKKVQYKYDDDIDKYLYYYRVWEYTQVNASFLKDNYKRGKEFHLDHIIPISVGFKYNIIPSIIGSFENIQIIKSELNFIKNFAITKDGEEVLSFFNMNLKELPIYRIENDKIVQLIHRKTKGIIRKTIIL